MWGMTARIYVLKSRQDRFEVLPARLCTDRVVLTEQGRDAV